jgi:hypothetical protein
MSYGSFSEFLLPGEGVPEDEPAREDALALGQSEHEPVELLFDLWKEFQDIHARALPSRVRRSRSAEPDEPKRRRGRS